MWLNDMNLRRMYAVPVSITSLKLVQQIKYT